MTAQQLLADIHSLEAELIAFERKYGIRSEIFYPAFMGGGEPENEAWVLDFGEWASVYRTWLTRHAEYRNEIELVQSDKGSLAGLIHVIPDRTPGRGLLEKCGCQSNRCLP